MIFSERCLKKKMSGNLGAALGGPWRQNDTHGTPREAFWKQKLIKNQIFADSGEDFSEKVNFAKIVVLFM